MYYNMFNRYVRFEESGMNSRYDIPLMVRIAQMYYIDGLKQEEIGEKLNISRSSVSMILTEAKEHGIVEVKYFIRNPLLNHEELSNKFESLFDIDKCIIIPSTTHDSAIMTKLAAERAAEELNENIEKNDVVGIAWGSTCYEFMSAYRAKKDLKNVSVVPLIGGSDRPSYKYQLNEMVRNFAEKVNGTPTFIYAPAMPDSFEDKNLYMKSSSMQSVVLKWQNINIAVISVGAPPDSPESKPGGDLNSQERKLMYEEDKTRPVGDICARHFNIFGEFIRDKYYERVIGIPIEDLRHVKKIICAAAGLHKTFSIIGALRTNMIHTFITDEQTARSVLKVLDMG